MHIQLVDMDESFIRIHNYFLKALVLRCMNNFYFMYQVKKSDSTTPT